MEKPLFSKGQRVVCVTDGGVPERFGVKFPLTIGDVYIISDPDVHNPKWPQYCYVQLEGIPPNFTFHQQILAPADGMDAAIKELKEVPELTEV